MLCCAVQVTIGPWTERGFFYDFDMPQPLTEKDLPKIRKEMQRILRKNLPFVREEVSAEEARRRIEVGSCPALPQPALLSMPMCMQASRAGALNFTNPKTRLWHTSVWLRVCKVLFAGPLP